MKDNSSYLNAQIHKLLMRHLFASFSLLLLVSCESSVADKDKRQIIAKDEIRNKLPPRSRAFDITHFQEDTLSSWGDSAFKRPIRYVLDYEYKDSTGTLQHRTGAVVFTPDGKSIIHVANDTLTH
jgi:hypothetical protein